MSQLIKPLERRIQELAQSIRAQEGQLTAYQELLKIEALRNSSTAPEESASPVGPETTGLAASLAAIPITTNKTKMVAAVVNAYGTSGVSPKEIDAFFAERKVEPKRNTVYSALSYFVARKKVRREDGRYFAVSNEGRPKKKRRLSADGLERIKAALKKRWAAKKAADKNRAA